MVTESKLMRAGEACRALAISRYTLKRYVEAGLIRTVNPLGQLRFLTEDVLKVASPEHQAATEVLLPIAAGKLLGVSARTVIRMCDRGRLRSVRSPGGRLRVIAVDVTRLLKEKGVQHAGPVKAEG